MLHRHYVCEGAEDTLGKYSLFFSNFGTCLCLDGTVGSSGMSSNDSLECGTGLVVWMSRQRAGPGGGRAYCGDMGGLARADILMEH